MLPQPQKSVTYENHGKWSVYDSDLVKFTKKLAKLPNLATVF